MERSLSNAYETVIYQDTDDFHGMAIEVVFWNKSRNLTTS